MGLGATPDMDITAWDSPSEDEEDNKNIQLDWINYGATMSLGDLTHMNKSRLR
jgi:hypothetical protein